MVASSEDFMKPVRSARSIVFAWRQLSSGSFLEDDVKLVLSLLDIDLHDIDLRIEHTRAFVSRVVSRMRRSNADPMMTNDRAVLIPVCGENKVTLVVCICQALPADECILARLHW